MLSKYKSLYGIEKIAEPYKPPVENKRPKIKLINTSSIITEECVNYEEQLILVHDLSDYRRKSITLLMPTIKIEVDKLLINEFKDKFNKVVLKLK